MAKELLIEVASLEDFDNFELLDRSQAKEILDLWHQSNIRRLRSPYIKKLLDAVGRGVDTGNVYMAVCTVNVFAAFLQKGFATLLEPVSALDPIMKLIDWLKQNSYDLGIAGFFAKNENALFVITNHPYVELGNEMFSAVLIHEMCHYFSHNNPKRFNELFFETYISPFYRTFIKKLAANSKSPLKEEQLNALADTYALKLLLGEAEISEDKWNKRVVSALLPFYKADRILLETLLYYMKNFNKDSVKDELDSIFYECYQETGIRIPHTASYMHQELFSPSEVVCLASLIHAKKPQYLTMLDEIFRS